MFYFLRGPRLHGTTIHAFRTARDRDDAIRAYRLSNIDTSPIEWDEVRALVPTDADGRHLVWGDFANGGPTRIANDDQNPA